MSLDRINRLIDNAEYSAALGALERALARAPGDLELVSMMSFVLAKLNQHVRAEHFARRLLAGMPDNPQALHNLANMLLRLGRHEESEPLFVRALALAPQEPQISLGYGELLSRTNRHVEAERVLARALAVNPGHPGLRTNWVHTFQPRGRIDEGIDHLRALAGEFPHDLNVADALCSTLNYAPGTSPAELFRAHRAFGMLLERDVGVPPSPAPAPARPDKRLRVGLVSPDLREHAVAHLIENFIEFADRKRFHITCYPLGPEDGTSARLRSHADRWTSLRGKIFADAAKVVRSDGIDVLVDLAGHTAGHGLALFAIRPAPVQMTYTGYPNTTGLRTVDYRIVDSLTDPEGVEAFHTERLLRLDPCYMSYRVPRELPAVRARGDGPVVFGSFSSLLKFNGPLLALWARVLKEVPGSRLVLMHTGLTEEGVREDVRARFAALGVEASRIDARPPAATREGVLPAYGDLDIALDTFPYNGAVTVVEALLMGVPYVSMAGKTSASRAALSVLTAVGHPEWCAATEDEYVRIAVELAGDAGGRAALRTKLREEVLASPICDGPGFARRFEALLERAWAERVRGA